eukprot:CCRYP_000429-RA/>CCRYP_000429-RA protein AED:0.26 eAED:0.26 QI:578/1/1/1/1/1/3/520/896
MATSLNRSPNPSKLTRPRIGMLRRAQSSDVCEGHPQQHPAQRVLGRQRSSKMAEQPLSSSRQTAPAVPTGHDEDIFRHPEWNDSTTASSAAAVGNTGATAPNSNSCDAPQDRLDSIFRARTNNSAQLHMSPIGTRQKILPANNDANGNPNNTNNSYRDPPSIRPSLSCPAAVFESPLRNLLEPLEGIGSSEVLEVSAIEFDDESVEEGPTSLALDNDTVLENANGELDAFPRNLNNAFDLMIKDQKTTNGPSPTSVVPPAMVEMEGVSVPLIALPPFQLEPALSGSLSPGLIARVSFYSVVRDINKEAADCLATDPLGREVVAEDGRVHVHPSPDEESKSILLGNASFHFSNALLDEEWFLLSAIASRSQDEVDSNLDSLFPTFAEAMGEAKEESGSRTQLWKPGRSWWEAKSGKNPWVEPVVHNNRWRYLWPLIHYHKFIAKCIKKLKRNGVDVKTSTSTVSIFLRQEVCHVSDHLAFMSKYDSEQWTNALRHFDGWTDHSPVVEATIQNLVLCQRLVTDGSDASSSLLQSQLDQTVLKAMRAVKEEAAKAAASDSYNYGKGHKGLNHSGNPVQGRNDDDCASQNSFLNGTIQPHGHVIQRSWSGSTANPQSATKSRQQGRPYEGSWREEYPPSHYNQGMYGPHYDHPPVYSQPYGTTIEPQYYHHYDQYPTNHHQIGYHHGGDMPYHNSQYGNPTYYNGYYDGSFHDGMIVDNSMHSESFVHLSAIATPSRYGNHPHYQMSPFHHDYWSHLNISQLPGIAPSPSMHTPSKPPRGSSNRSFRKRQGKNAPLDGHAKSLILFPKQANSPASRFVMSPQDKSNPYYSARNFQSSNLNLSVGQEESFVLPTIEDFAQDSPGKATNRSVGPMELSVPPVVKKIYMESRNEEVEGQSSED